MPIVSLETLKGYFNEGDVPTESNYIDLIDTLGSTGGDSIELDATSPADPRVIFSIDGTPTFVVGVDNDDSDIFKINTGSTLANPSKFEMDASGNVEIAGDIVNFGALYPASINVGGISDPGDDNVTIAGNLDTVGGYIRVDDYLSAIGGVRIASTHGDPGPGNLYMEGNASIGGWAYALGGIHVGGTSDPGDDNLLVDGNIQITRDSVVTGRIHHAGSYANGTARTMTTAFQNIVDLNITIPTGGAYLFVFGRVHYTTSDYDGLNYMETRIVIDGSSKDTCIDRPLNNNERYNGFVHWYGSVVAGNLDITLQARKQNSAGIYLTSAGPYSSLSYMLFL